MYSFPRRRLLVGAVSAVLLVSCLAAGAAARASAEAAPRARADVIVVGAGISGLAAATKLRAAGRSVLVLEAMPRVGGRLQRARAVTPAGGSAWYDLGGQWIGNTQTLALQLVKRLNVTTFPSPSAGAQVLCFDGRCTRHNKSFPFAPFDAQQLKESWRGVNFTPAERDDVVQLWRKVEALAAQVDPVQPWTSPNARAFDATTVLTWLNANARTAMGRWSIAAMCRMGGSGAFEPSDTSMLHMAWTQRVAPQSESPEGYLLDGAAGQLPALLAAQLGGNTVRVSQPVYRISQDAGEGTVTALTPSGTYVARAAIVAMPPHLTGRIAYDPPMPADRDQLVQRTPMGSLIKVLLVYNSSWWHQDGLSGAAAGNLGTIDFIADSSNPKPGSPGVLATFIAGAVASRLARASVSERREAVLKDVVTLLGPEARSELVAYREGNWPAESYIGGAFTAFMPPGVWTQLGNMLRQPQGRVLWAGTEVATRWPGYIDGGLRAGEDAAAAALKML